MHATSVGVLTIGLDAPLVLETAEHGATTTRSAYAPARTPHRVVAPEGRILLLFTDSADAPAGRAAAAMRRLVGPYGLDHRRERELIAACSHSPDPDVLRFLVGPCVPGTTDRRIRRVVDEIRDDPGRAFRAEETACRLGLSTPHFLRLFAQHTSTTFRRYQQWNRLLQVTRGIAAGHTLTRCAADAGFASQSHLSDTFRRTLGTTATSVLDSRVQFYLDC
ncbi:AraC family transcriptional regulator [Streptomyces atratus]|uniref:AraC family transcriptional regulator n=1 Tax=Streptomyces atratus TaxID=1893 RepID=UPI0033C01FE1